MFEQLFWGNLFSIKCFNITKDVKVKWSFSFLVVSDVCSILRLGYISVCPIYESTIFICMQFMGVFNPSITLMCAQHTQKHWLPTVCWSAPLTSWALDFTSVFPPLCDSVFCSCRFNTSLQLYDVLQWMKYLNPRCHVLIASDSNILGLGLQHFIVLWCNSDWCILCFWKLQDVRRNLKSCWAMHGSTLCVC